MRDLRAIILCRSLVLGLALAACARTPESPCPPGGDPGLLVIRNHVHLRTHLGRGEDVLTPWLRAGVTTLVDTGTARGGIARLRELARTVAAEPPRLYVAGPIFTAPGGYPATRREEGVRDGEVIVAP